MPVITKHALMKFILHPDFTAKKETVLQNIKNFAATGTLFGNGDRNIIRLFNDNGFTYNIKSFKVPNLINKIVYRYFRKSKAERSYIYAVKLLQKGIGTPQPVGYLENYNAFGFYDSYYISEHLLTDLTFRELIEVPDYPDHENILRQFTRFCFELHEKGIEFLDHSPGNTLIKETGQGQYAFYLVDLNRMKFHDGPMDFDARINNMKRLTHVRNMAVVMSDEYAAAYGKSREEVLAKMLAYIEDFHKKLQRRRRLKKQIKFWKKK